MPAAVRTESRTHSREPSFVSILSGWAQQGAQSLFATQRILLDLAMRQNANVMHDPPRIEQPERGEGLRPSPAPRAAPRRGAPARPQAV